MDCSPQGSSVHGISWARILEWVAIPSPGDLPKTGIEPKSPALQVDSLWLSHRKPWADIWEPFIIYLRHEYIFRVFILWTSNKIISKDTRMSAQQISLFLRYTTCSINMIISFQNETQQLPLKNTIFFNVNLPCNITSSSKTLCLTGKNFKVGCNNETKNQNYWSLQRAFF